MDVPTGRDNRLDSTRIERDVDEACDRFEAAWRAGDRPLIEDFLGGTTDSDRPVLLRHLLDLELDYRGGLGESPGPSEYRRRFPGHEGLIDSIFAEFVRQSKVVRGGDLETLVRTGWDGPRSGSATSPPPDVFPNIPGFEILSELGRGGMGVVYKARQIRLNRLCALKIAPARRAHRRRVPRPLPGGGRDHRQAQAPQHRADLRPRRPRRSALLRDGVHRGGQPRPAARRHSVGTRARGADGRGAGPRHRGCPSPGDRPPRPQAGQRPADGRRYPQDRGLRAGQDARGRLESDAVGGLRRDAELCRPRAGRGLDQDGRPGRRHLRAGSDLLSHADRPPPFQAATVLQTLEQVKTADPVPPSRLQPGLSRDAETICLKCLEKDPQRRYADAAALAEDLDRFLAGRPILARPTGAVERLRKWIRRRPAVALLSAAVVAVTVLGFILVSWQWRRAEAKAAAEAAANERAQQARLVAFEKQAQLTFHQALALCDQGEVGRGLLWLARSLELATEAQSEGLDRPIRINLADWASQLSRPRRLPPMRHSGPILGLAFRREGRALVSVGKDGVARIWDTTTGNQVEPSLELKAILGRTAGARPVRPRRERPAGGGRSQGRATVWDVNHRRRLASPRRALRAPHRDIAFPDLKYDHMR